MEIREQEIETIANAMRLHEQETESITHFSGYGKPCLGSSCTLSFGFVFSDWGGLYCKGDLTALAVQTSNGQ